MVLYDWFDAFYALLYKLLGFQCRVKSATFPKSLVQNLCPLEFLYKISDPEEITRPHSRSFWTVLYPYTSHVYFVLNPDDGGGRGVDSNTTR